MSNVIPINSKEAARAHIAAAIADYERDGTRSVDSMLRLASAMAGGRKLFKADQDYGAWLGSCELDFIGRTDRAALIAIAAYPQARETALDIGSFSPRRVLEELKRRYPEPGIPAAEPTSVPETPKPASVAAPEAESPSTKQAIPEVILPTALVSRPVAAAPEAYPVPVKSKLREMIGAETADVLLARFKSARWMFTAAIGSAKATNNHKAMLRYLANRCQQPDYPAELLLEQTWTPQLLYPHLPKRLVASMPTNIGTLYSKHAALIETERRFMASPKFGVTDPPLAAFNEAQAIYTSVVNTRKGNAPDPAAIHRPSYGDDEGKPPVIVRGTRLWPAEQNCGYCYDDLRCACGFASDVMNTFDDTRNASLSSRTLKLRHLMSWVDGGYNSTGSTTNGMLKAMRSVIDAYSKNISEEMRNPSPSMTKNDGP